MTTDGYNDVAKPALVLPDPLSITIGMPVASGALKKVSDNVYSTNLKSTNGFATGLDV